MLTSDKELCPPTKIIILTIICLLSTEIVIYLSVCSFIFLQAFNLKFFYQVFLQMMKLNIPKRSEQVSDGIHMLLSGFDNWLVQSIVSETSFGLALCLTAVRCKFGKWTLKKENLVSKCSM